MTLYLQISNVRRHRELGANASKALVEAVRADELPMFYGPGISCHFADDEAYVHAIRVPGDATDAADLTRAEMQGRRDAWTMFRTWKKNVPGFEDSYFVTCGPYIGVRETRRLIGQYVLTENNIRECRRLDDAIATGCWYMDRHPNRTTIGTANAGDGGHQPDPYDIPYRAIVAREVENLLVAGRWAPGHRPCRGANPDGLLRARPGIPENAFRHARVLDVARSRLPGHRSLRRGGDLGGVLGENASRVAGLRQSQ